MSTTSGTTETTKRCDASKVKPGAVFSRHSFGTVILSERGLGGGSFRIRNEKGFEWDVGREILEQEFSFADQFESEETVSRTKAIEVLTANPRTAMTVHFRKAPDPKAVAEALKAGQGAAETDKSWRKRVEELMAGDERTMEGHHNSSFDEHRRLSFIENAKGPRLVDPRTIEWLICDRKKWVVK